MVLATSLALLTGCQLFEEPGLGNEQALEGEMVTLVGDVEETYVSGAFRFDPEEGWINEDAILVVPLKGVSTPDQLTEARVHGRVERMDDETFKAKFGFDIAPLREALDHQAFVVAERVEVIGRR